MGLVTKTVVTLSDKYTQEDGQVMLSALQGVVRLLMEDYAYFIEHPDALCAQLDTLVELRGKETVRHWQALAGAGRWPDLLADLMARHYDPLYDRSIERSFARSSSAPQIRLKDGDAETLHAAARTLIAG